MKSHLIIGPSVFAVVILQTASAVAARTGPEQLYPRPGGEKRDDFRRSSAALRLDVHDGVADSGVAAPSSITALDALGLNAPSSASAQNFQQSPADSDYLRGLGFIGDGSSHALSSIMTFRRASSAKYTLA
jgi:hypothetical protein